VTGKDCAVRLVVAVAGMLGVSVLLAPAATAGPLVDSAENCDPAPVSMPFMRWVDPMQYTPIADGGIERRAQGWTLKGDARPVEGNEPWRVRHEDDDTSLSIPTGSSATTPTICVGLAEPTLRFFARRTSGSGASALLVEVLFEDALGEVRALPIGADLGGGWHPSQVMPILVNLLPLLPGEQTPVAFRFTPRGTDDWEIDDVYVDPWCMR
jgi:hypothetical protein